MLYFQNKGSCVLNIGGGGARGGSNFFALERGVTQHCPLSPYIILLCVEILVEKIKTNKDIEVNEIKISQ